MPVGPLDGITVVDLSRALAGPYATLMLADAGADVVKVERPDGGDDARGWGPPFVDDDPLMSTYFFSVNRSKRSICLDFKRADDLAQLRQLVAGADVLVENFRPGVMDRLGLGPSALAAMNDRLVVLSISGFGEGGPDGHRPGFDQILQGEAGLMSLTGFPDGPPTRFGVPITDILSGMFGAFGVVAALHERETSGRGQRVTTSLLAAGVAVHTYHGTRYTVGGEMPRRTGNRHAAIAPYGAYRCADGWINIAVGSESLWSRFARALDIDDEGQRFATNADRVAHVDALEAVINDRLAVDTVERWLALLTDSGIPAGRIRELDEVYAWEQLEHLGLIDEIAHPSVGAVRVAGAPVAWSRSGRRPASCPPALGGGGHEVPGPAPADGSGGEH